MGRLKSIFMSIYRYHDPTCPMVLAFGRNTSANAMNRIADDPTEDAIPRAGRRFSLPHPARTKSSRSIHSCIPRPNRPMCFQQRAADQIDLPGMLGIEPREPTR